MPTNTIPPTSIRCRRLLHVFASFMIVFTNRMTFVRSYFVKQNFLSQNTRRTALSRPPTTPAAYTPIPPFLSLRRSYHVSHTRCEAKWNVGDDVTVNVDNEDFQGMIQEVRGSGWYAVTVRGDDQRDAWTVKCRSSQLRVQTKAVSKKEASTQDAIAEPSKTFFPSTLERTTIYSDEGKKPDFPPPPPTIYDFDTMQFDKANITNILDKELIAQMEHHASFQKWVVFTDLHCSPASLDTCLEVLDRVHEEAVARNAGVLFLGDFWHHRGTIRVDCLNAVLGNFRKWTVPMIMIPGNHDQVTLNGHSHGLTPFENAYRVGDVPGPMILTYPTKFREGLFVPHIRDVATMESILQSSVAKEASALFVHADVKGALMNDLVVSYDGVPPASFPNNKVIYSGHFHKPHTVKSKNVEIEYVGSPYETSLSEAQQAKSLAVLGSGWECIERIPLDIGRKHYKVSTLAELLEMQITHRNSTADSNSESATPTLRPGDRLVASIDTTEAENMSFNISSHAEQLREAGVVVEIRQVKQLWKNRRSEETSFAIESIPELSRASTWKAYLEQELSREAITEDMAKVLTEAGLDVIENLESAAEEKKEASAMTDLVMDCVSVQGFGPFRKKTTYPLSQRGLVLLKGQNTDSGSDSNGSGKSSLAMAALWALTGSMDPRRAQDGKVSDVVHDESKTARVTLEGTLNGSPFLISRTKTASKSGLIFKLGDSDLTTQSPKETQALIYEQLGVTPQTLSRTVFFGQHDMNDLLEATDTKFKDELSLLVPLEGWKEAAVEARARSRAASKRASEFEGMMKIRSEDISMLTSKHRLASQRVDSNRENLLQLEERIKAETDKGNALAQQLKEVDFDTLEKGIQLATEGIECLRTKRIDVISERDQAMEEVQAEMVSVENSYSSALSTQRSCEQQVFSGNLKLDMAKSKVDEVERRWSISLQEGREETYSAPKVCPTCHQEISSDDHGHSSQSIEKVMETEIDEALQEQQHRTSQVEEASSALRAAQEDFQKQEGLKSEIEEKLLDLSQEWQSKIQLIDVELEGKQQEKSDMTGKMAALAQQSQLALQRESTIKLVEREKAELEFSLEALTAIAEEKAEVEERLKSIVKDIEKNKQLSRTMTSLSDCFGQRGVQTFVLQNVVDQLQTLTQAYLDELSDGVQRLDLSLETGDRIARSAQVCAADGSFKDRPLATLSGGQWRRCSLALSFGFAELVARRGRLRSSLCVLDEPLTHLDRSGRSKVGDVIRAMLRQDNELAGGFGGLGISTVLLILQDLAAEELDEAFDFIDEVVKEDNQSYVRIDGSHS